MVKKKQKLVKDQPQNSYFELTCVDLKVPIKDYQVEPIGLVAYSLIHIDFQRPIKGMD